MKSLCIALAALVFLTTSAVAANPDRTTLIERFITETVAKYPEANLCDIYKSAFQDKFGPGHLINDKDAARKYLEYELSEMDSDYDSNPLYEPTGVDHNFYRVNLSVVKDSLISVEEMIDALTTSANNTVMPSITEWQDEWAEIKSVIDSLGLDFPDKSVTLKAIAQSFAEGKYVMHHSDRFNEAYHPHYRIIARDVFLDKILPSIQAGQ